MKARRIKFTPGIRQDNLLNSFIQLLDQEADIDVYVHGSDRTIKITPHTEITPTDHQLDDGRTVYVFRMGRHKPSEREYIVVVTSVEERYLALNA
jgi:hypothetical protein